MINLHTDIDIKTLPISEAHKKIDDINQIAEHFWSIKNYDDSKSCADEALQMAEVIDYKKGIADAKYNLGMINNRKENFLNAITELMEVEKMYEAMNEQKKQVFTCRTLAISLWNIGDYSQEIEYFFKALHISKAIGETDFEGDTLNSIGNYYMELGENNSALEYYKMALNIKKKTRDVRGIIFTLYNIALMYNNMSSPLEGPLFSKEQENTNYEKALKYYYEAFEFNKKLECDPFLENRIKQNIGLTYGNIGREEEAIEIFKKCLDYYTKTDNNIDKCDTFIYMANSYRKINKMEEAKIHFMKAKDIAESLNMKRLISHVNRDLSGYYEGIKDFKTALAHNRIYSELTFEKIKTLAEDDIRKLNILHKVDITKKETEVLAEKNDELKSINAELTKLNNEKNYFLNLAANDLKAPLEKITDTVNLVKTNKKDSRVKNLSEILIESSYMQKVISDLLTINESESAK